MLRVLHVIASVSMAQGGPSGAVRTMANALAQRDVRVDVVTTDDDGRSRNRALPLDEFVAWEGQRVRYFPRQTRKYSASVPMLRWLRSGVRDYDVVQSHGLFNLPAVAAAHCARQARVPYIMTPHGVLDTWGLSNKSALLKARSLRLVEGPLLNAADAVHFMSELEQARAATLALPIRAVVLPLGFDFRETAHADDKADEHLCAGGRQVILYLARIHPVKRVDVLLRAFAGLPRRDSIVLAIAGDGEPGLIAELKALASTLGVESNVRWLGFASGSRKSALLTGAQLFVLPSASENFGVAIVEAMHAGLPVVVTQGVGLASLVERAGAGLVADHSVEGLRSAMQRLLDDEPLRSRMGHAGRDVVARELSLEAFGARLETLYRSVLSADEAMIRPLGSPS